MVPWQRISTPWASSSGRKQASALRIFAGIAPFPMPSSMLHLLHTYSNTPELLTSLESVASTVRRTDLQDEPTLPSTKRVWRLHDRLTEAEMDAVVISYYSGTPVAQLARQYGINHWSVNKLVHERGHRFHRDCSEDAMTAL